MAKGSMMRDVCRWEQSVERRLKEKSDPPDGLLMALLPFQVSNLAVVYIEQYPYACKYTRVHLSMLTCKHTHFHLCFCADLHPVVSLRRRAEGARGASHAACRGPQSARAMHSLSNNHVVGGASG